MNEAEQMIGTVKHCTRCNTSKPLDDFYKCSRNSDGRQNRCRECQKLHQRRGGSRAAERQRARIRRLAEKKKREDAAAASPTARPVVRRTEQEIVKLREQEIEQKTALAIAALVRNTAEARA